MILDRPKVLHTDAAVGKTRVARLAGTLSACLLILFAATGAALADPHPAGLRDHRFNGPIKPTTAGGVTTFRIEDEGCSTVDYGDGRGENDCRNGNVRSAIVARNWDKLGDAVEYRFDIQVDPGLNYPGRFSHEGKRWHSNLRIASWEGPLLHNFLYILQLDSRRGITFLDNVCVPADRLGEWNRFSMKIRWSANDRGWIKVTCNDEVVYLAEGVATNQAPNCYVGIHCEPGVRKNPDRFLFVLGMIMDGWGMEWARYGFSSQFSKIQPEGITVRMRNVAIEKGAVLYDEQDREIIRHLQAHLTQLGCDPGPVDGVVGARTREAALSCRSFEGEQLPEKLDVTTAREILSMYERRYPLP